MEKEKRKKVLSSKEKRINVTYCIISVLIAIVFLFPIYGLSQCPLNQMQSPLERL